MKIQNTPIMKTSIIHFLLLSSFPMLLWISALPPVLGQTLAEARELAHSGKYLEAESILQTLSTENPNDPEITLARAYNFSWWARYTLALDAFSHVLKNDPSHPDALKGIAFTYLYQGNYSLAIDAFAKALNTQPNNYDLYLGIGMAHLQAKDYPGAQEAFSKALELQPDSREARQFIQSASLAPSYREADIWLGYSLLDGQENAIGLRGLQLSLQAAPKWRAILKYDNSLALDVLQIARSENNAPLVSIGTVREWNKQLFTELEYGLRFLDENKTQHFITGGQVFFLPKNIRIKAGGFAGIGKKLDSEWMTYLSINLPVFAHFRVEPTYYYVQPPNSPGAEHRFQMGLQFQTNRGYQLNVYGIYGSVLPEEGNSREKLFGWSATGLLPFSKSVWAQATIRQEKGVFYDFTSMALGLKIRLPR